MNNADHNLSRIEAAFSALRRAKINARERFGEHLQLTRTQLEILIMLAEKPQTTGELSRQLFLTQSAVTQTIDTLVRRDLAQRQPDQLDRRIIQLRLSTAGQKLTSHIRALRRAHLEAIVSHLTEAEIKTFLHVAQTFINHLEALEPTQKPLNEETK